MRISFNAFVYGKLANCAKLKCCRSRTAGREVVKGQEGVGRGEKGYSLAHKVAAFNGHSNCALNVLSSAPQACFVHAVRNLTKNVCGREEEKGAWQSPKGKPKELSQGLSWLMASIMLGHAFHFNPFSANSEMQLQN